MSSKPIKLDWLKKHANCKDYHRRSEVAKILGVTVRTTYNLKKRGLQFGYKGVIACEKLREFVESGRLSTAQIS